MSRSFKKNPFISDNSIFFKKQARRTTRRKIKNMIDMLPSNGDYNKLYKSYYIHDYSPRWSKENAMRHYNEFISENSVHRRKNTFSTKKHRREESLEDYLKYWAKCAYRK